MDFGKLPSVDGVDFSLPQEDERSRQLLSRSRGGTLRLFFGAPVWSTREWVGRVYPKGTQPRDFLREYARQFTGIELNSTFYGVPADDTIRNWRESTPEAFRFCPKVHQDISHGRAPEALQESASRFRHAIEGLGPRLGLSFLQLPPGFGPAQREDLKEIQQALGAGFPLAVEFRHPAWFSQNRIRGGAFEWMAEQEIAPVITDVAGRRDVLHASLTTPRAMVRFVGNALHPTDYVRIDAWAERIRSWRDQGLEELHFFIHQPDNVLAPELLTYFVRKVNAVCGMQLEEWKSHELPPQMEFFG